MQTITLRRDGQQGPPYSTENYIQSPGINHTGKEYIYFLNTKKSEPSQKKRLVKLTYHANLIKSRHTGSLYCTFFLSLFHKWTVLQNITL